jgi:hypothetical protein
VITDVSKKQELRPDPIVAEVRRVRKSLFATAGYDIREFCRRLREGQVTSGHSVVTRPTPTSSDQTV